MAELLIRAKDNHHPDPVKDLRGSWKRGMIVAIKPDGHEWGAEEKPPGFVIVRVTGVGVDELRPYYGRLITPEGATRRARWMISPAIVDFILASGGRTTMSVTELRNQLTDLSILGT